MRDEELILNLNEVPTQEGPEPLMLAASDEKTHATADPSLTVLPLPFSSIGSMLPTDVYTIPYTQINAPFEAALQQYLTEDPKVLLKSIQTVSKSVNYKSYDFFTVQWEELFTIPVDEEHDEALRITQDVKEGGVDSLPRVLAVNASIQPKDVVFFATVTSEERELSTEADLGDKPDEPPIIIPPPTEGEFTISNQSAALGGAGGDPPTQFASGVLFQGLSISTVFMDTTSPPTTEIPFDTFFTPLGAGVDGITITSEGSFTYQYEFPTAPSGSHTFFFQLVDTGGNTSNIATLTINGYLPVVLDLTGEGINLLSPEVSGVMVGDIDGSENSSPIGWIGSGNGVLMLDTYGDGSLNDLNQIAFMEYTPGATTDLEGLISFDTNNNGLLDSGDDAYHEFGVLSSGFDYISLAEMGIVSLSLTSDHNAEALNGNYVHGYTSYETEDGQTHAAADVVLSIHSDGPPTITVSDILWDDDTLDAQLPHSSAVETLTSELSETALVVLPPTPLEALESNVPVQQEVLA